MRLDLRVVTDAGAAADVLVQVDEAATVASLASQVAQTLGLPATSDLWCDGVHILGDSRLGDAPLHRGATIALSPTLPTRRPALPASGWQVHVVGGPHAGLVWSLPVGRHELGRSGPFALPDGSVSRRHAVIDVGPGGATIADLGSKNGTLVEGIEAPVEGAGRALPVSPGQIIALGDSLLAIATAPTPDAALRPAAGGSVSFTRPPRMRPRGDQTQIVLPTPPERPKGRRVSVLAITVPLVMGVAIAVFEKNPAYLLFALASPLMGLGNLVGDRRRGAMEHREATRLFGERRTAVSRQITDALAQETRRRRHDHPDPATLFLVATVPGKRLWERRRDDPDALCLRVGCADLASELDVREAFGHGAFGHDPSGHSPTARRSLYCVPANLDLREAGVVGIAGPLLLVDSVARWLIVQLAVLHPPRDLALTLLTSPGRTTCSWFAWLPHAGPMNPNAAVASVGNDAESISARVAELSELVRSRHRASPITRTLDRSGFPAHVVVLADADHIQSVPGMAQILKDGPDVGVFAICLVEDERHMPEECTAIVKADIAVPANVVIQRTEHDPMLGVLADQVSDAYADRVARCLAPLALDRTEQGDSSIPDSARLLDVLGLEPPTADAIRARWMLEDRSTRMSIGMAADGMFCLDLAGDGPHALVAGTTGAGKSELLQSIIASLAVSNRPDRLNFVLIDYKGGSAFKDCVRLPHAVGMVTDLDAHLVERAMTSLGAELRRRERLLAAAATKDIDDYYQAADRDLTLGPMPRLVIVIDEFASMVRDLPDFVTGLVSIAQRGRSLGIHLILATQRPSGIVSNDIRANTNLRISLRVTDASDSSDVIDAPDAARIAKTTPGRGFARLGHGALVGFQAARIGGRRPGAVDDHLPPFVALTGWGQVGYPPPEPGQSGRHLDPAETDLGLLVAAIRQAAEQEGIPGQLRPWLPPLPVNVGLDELASAGSDDWESISYGLEDLPAAQLQRPAKFDLRTGHMLVIGSARSGRSQLLRTIAVSAARSCGTADIHLCGLDFGNGALKVLESLPHCGAVVGRTQEDRAMRLLNRMTTEIERRQRLLGTGGYSDVAEQRRSVPPAERLPHILLLLDRWEGFTDGLSEVDGGRAMQAILAILREGASVGVHAVLAGDKSLASSRVGSLCENKLALKLAERSDYAYLGMSPRQLPDEIPPGRGFDTTSLSEVQVALIGRDESGQGQAAAIAEIAQVLTAGKRDPLHMPFRVDDLPARIAMDEVLALRDPGASGLVALCGVGGDELAALGADLGANPGFVVAGPPRSGRSSALAVMAWSLLLSGGEVLVAAPRKSPLRQLSGVDGVRAVVTDPSASSEEWSQHLGLAPGRALVVVIDDGEGLKDSKAGELFRQVLRDRWPGVSDPARRERRRDLHRPGQLASRRQEGSPRPPPVTPRSRRR